MPAFSQPGFDQCAVKLLELTEADFLPLLDLAVSVGKFFLKRGIVARREMMEVGGKKQTLFSGAAVDDRLELGAGHGGSV